MPRLRRIIGLIGSHFAAPGVGAYGGDLFLVYPLRRFKGESGCFTAGIAAPLFGFQALFHLAGAHNHKIAAFDGDTLRLGAGIQIIVGDGFAIGQKFFTKMTRNIE